MLRHLSPPDAELLYPALRKVSLVQGQVLFEPGDEVDHVYFPVSGLIALVSSMLSGEEVDCGLRGRDGGVGYVEACGSGRMGARAVAQAPGEALRIPARAFCCAHDASESLRAVCARRVEFMLVETRQSLACHALHPASGRLARLLLECADRTGETRFPLGQQFIATMIGVGRTTVTHAASELKRLGLIRYARGRVELVDRPGLQAYVCECYALIRDARRRILGFESVEEAA